MPLAPSSTSGGGAASNAFKSTRRRLSILMPIFGPGEAKDKSNSHENSTCIELLNLKTDDTSSKTEDEYGKRTQTLE